MVSQYFTRAARPRGDQRLHAARNTVGAVQSSAADVVGRNPIRSEPSSALNQLNNEHDHGNHE
jgi:hypothetical protein